MQGELIQPNIKNNRNLYILMDNKRFNTAVIFIHGYGDSIEYSLNIAFIALSWLNELQQQLWSEQISLNLVLKLI